MNGLEITFQEEQQIKKWGIEHGIDIPWTKDGKIDPVFIIGLKIGGALGEILKTHGEDTFIETVNKVSDITGLSVKKGDYKNGRH